MKLRFLIAGFLVGGLAQSQQLIITTPGSADTAPVGAAKINSNFVALWPLLSESIFSVTASNGFTGTVTSNALTIGTSIAGPIKGISGGLAAASSTDIVGLFGTGCSSSTFLNGTGGCSAPSGTGTVTSVGLNLPNIFTVSPAVITTSGNFNVVATGTSGGIPYFSTSTNLVSSAALGTNSLVLGGGAGGTPTFVPSLGTSTTILHGNASGAPTWSPAVLTTDVSGILPVANGGSGTAAPSLVGGTGITITGSWPNQTIVGGSPGVTSFATANGFAGTVTSNVGTLTTSVTGVLKGNGTALSAAASSDIYGLWTGTCSSSTYLNGAGACATPSGTGTVSSVGLTAPSIFTVTGSPVTASGNLGLVASGTSGGLPYFSSATTLASSSAYTANALLVGGGAGSPPSNVASLGTNTTVLHGNASGLPTYGSVALSTDVSGTLQAAQTPAYTGDVTKAAGSLTTSVVKVNGAAVPTSAGVLASNSSQQLTTATSAGVIGLWSGTCNSGTWLNGVGACTTPSGGLPTIANGSTLANVSGSTAQPVAVTLPVINLQYLGACGITDGTTIFNAAITTATSTSQAIYIPSGCTVNHSGVLTLTTGITLIGDGLGSILNATDLTATNPHQALQMQGTNVEVRGINFTSSSTTTTRSGQLYSAAVSVNGATLSNYKILNNYFTTGTFAGPWIEVGYGTSNGEIAGNRMTGTTLSNPTIYQSSGGLGNLHLDIHDNLIAGTSGDTCFEVVDYTASTTPGNQYLDIHDNDMSNCGAHGISWIGAAHSIAQHNKIYNVADRAFYIASESGDTEPITYDITVDGNVLVGNNTALQDYQILVYGRTGYPVTDINITNNIINITTTNFDAIQIGTGCSCSSTDIETARINITGNVIHGDGTHGTTGVGISGGTDVLITNNTFDTLLAGAIQTYNGNYGVLKVNDNHFYNLGASGSSPIIYLDDSNHFTFVSLLNNTITPGTNALSYLVSCSANTYPVLVSNNWAPGIQSNGCLAVGNNVITTVTNLPSCTSTLNNQIATVTDATSPTYNGTLTGGGTTQVPTYCNGSAWKSH